MKNHHKPCAERRGEETPTERCVVVLLMVVRTDRRTRRKEEEEKEKAKYIQDIKREEGGKHQTSMSERFNQAAFLCLSLVFKRRRGKKNGTSEVFS